MHQAGRNDPCPCGSGRKYKKCCLQKENEAAALQREESNAVGAALTWLSEHHPEAVEEAVHDGYFSALDDPEIDALGTLHPGIQDMVNINVGEWLLTDAQFEVGEEILRARDLLFAPGGPVLTAHGRQWLEAINERRMGLYEVTEVDPGVGLQVQDILQDDPQRLWVTERSASEHLVPGDMLGARLAGRGDQWVFSGAIYPLGREDAQDCREDIVEELREEDWNGELARDLIGDLIATYWLQSLVGAEPMPELVDAVTGEPVMLCTEHYRVRDWSALEAALAERSDVEGSRQRDWVRFVEPDGEVRRARAALNVREPDGLEVFCRTLQIADETKAWLQEVAGEALEHRAREVTDPASP
ncbi:MAG: SEC-C metal-binding domain-containing protein [Deferrisomatales bacterium]|nr:SEC-C metal-binding domain-containing protein [Deferrisomatales bacterium]